MSSGDPARFSAAFARFEEIAELAPDAQARALEALAVHDPALAAAVQELLRADAAAGEEFLARGAAELDPSLLGAALDGAESAGVEPGDRLGPYRLRTLLGQGGMGEVWEAERADGQFEQTVALKLLKKGMDSAAVLRRFLQERQILARLEHPNIARLLDGGIAPDGRPYLVLERVQGEPIHDWCRGRGSSIGERLRLMIAVCEAVDSAHRNLIVHRDLKPSNILVDRDGRVKLLDFGIAKLLASEGESEDERTRLEERALTPAYAAPEQILGQPVTTATDVYALGVVLYELLSGQLPHRRNPSSVVALADELQRETLVRPSRVAAANGDLRQARLLTGDLDTILLKALAREPARRYGGAAALADDLARHLDGRPVAARPDRVGYRVSKFVGRHRIVVVASSLALLALLVATGVSIRQAKIAGLEAAKANAIQKFVFGLFEVNRVRNPDGAKARETTAQELLQLAAGELGKSAPEGGVAGEVRAELLDTVANLQSDLGLHDEAVRLWSELARELEKRTPDTHLAEVLVNRGVSANLIGRGDEARADFERALAILAGVEPSESASKLRGWALYNLGNHFWSTPGSEKGRAEELFREAVAVLSPLGPSHALANAHYGLGRLLESRPDPEGAQLSFQAGIAAAEAAPGIARTVLAGGFQQLSRVQVATQDFSGAEASIRRAMTVFEEFAGKEHRLTIEAGNDLGRLFDATDRPVEALSLLERALADRLARLGPMHAMTISTRFSLAQARLNAGDVASALAEASTLARDVAADARLREDRGGIVTFLHARALLLAGRLDEAAAELGAARPLILTRLGEQSPWLVDADLLESEIDLARGAPRESLTKLAAAEGKLAGPAATDQRRARFAVLRSAANLDLGDGQASRVAATQALEIAMRTPGREYRRLAEAAAWRAAGRAAALLGDRPAAAEAAAKARELYRAALLPASSGLHARELELDRLSR